MYLRPLQDVHLAPISEALGNATRKVARARSLVEVPASDWVIMSLMTGARAKDAGLGAAGLVDGGDGDGFEEGFGEGPFAFGMGPEFGAAAGPDTESAHQAVEAAAEAIAEAERLIRVGEKRCTRGHAGAGLGARRVVLADSFISLF